MLASSSGRALHCAQLCTVPTTSRRLQAHSLAQGASFSSQKGPCRHIYLLASGARSIRSSSQQLGRLVVRAEGKDSDTPSQYNKEFGYSRKDVILIGAGLIGIGYALYYGAQAFGVEATVAGNYVQLFIFLVICIGYVSTYIFRVANKDMTYAKQLEQYEERVMQKRLEEMPESERERLLREVEEERGRKAGQ